MAKSVFAIHSVHTIVIKTRMLFIPLPTVPLCYRLYLRDIYMCLEQIKITTGKVKIRRCASYIMRSRG